MEVLALGSIEARLNGQSYPIGGVKQRALLARLLATQGRPVSTTRLCEELWDDRAPRNPAHALQARVSRLRAALPMLTIEQVGSGYRLDHLRVLTDIARFEKLRDEGVWLLTDGALLRASDRLREALDLWRGPAFADIPSVPAIQAESARLDKLWASALADRIDIDLALGSEAAIIPELASIVEENLLLERFWGQLMLALYRDGQVQEALGAYARARGIFAERFGVEPNGELGKLHLRILQREPSESLLRIPLAARLPAQPASLRPPTADAGRLITSNETTVLSALLQQQRSLLLTGPVGIGKTHLLRSLRAHLEAQHCLAPLLSASALSQSTPLGVFAGVAGFLSEDWKTPLEVINSFARHRSTTVLLVDNVTQLDEASLFVVRQLVNTARVPVLIAARTVTDLPEEIRALYDSGELAEVTVDTLSDDEAEELAAAIAGGALTPDTRLSVIESAAGVPLRVREIITGSKAAGRLTPTDVGWQLWGEPLPSPRLAQLAGERFDAFDVAVLEALSLVAIAGDYPVQALEPSLRRTLARTDALELSDDGWWRLVDPMDREVLRTRCSELLWRELTGEAVDVLKSDLASGKPEAIQRAHRLALDLGGPVDVLATVTLAERALGVYDEHLALRAAETIIRQDPEHVEAHRLAGVASSVLRMPEVAEAHFQDAYRHCASAMEHVRVAMDHARHHGLRLYDVREALAIIEMARSETAGTDICADAHLERARMSWMTIGGMTGKSAPHPEMPTDAVSAMGLIAVGMAAVITGPLEEAHRVLAQLRQMPGDMIDLVPGGTALITLTEIMAVSYSGDLVSAQRMLRQNITKASSQAPESLGDWEYALAFSEMLSGDTADAYTLAGAAVEHLQWRDTTGLLPAAHALRAAGAQVTGHQSLDPQFSVNATLDGTADDPKVIMLREWVKARTTHAEGHAADAARTLVQAAQWLLTAQHSYFAGMCAHYAVRTGHEQQEASVVLNDAYAIAGGGLLAFLVRHAEASLAGDLLELDRIAHQARELGLTATAADTWTFVIENSGADASADRLRRQRTAVEQLYAEAPTLASWTT